MMRILKSLAIAFSTYSVIPVPQFPWKKEDMKYVLVFFPLVGVPVGAALLLWTLVCGALDIGGIARALIGTIIPVLITGGIHADGFMDTVDALSSRGSREKKLEILKDPHCGAFSVIMMIVYFAVYAAALSEVSDTRVLLAVCAGFVLSRSLSGIGAVALPAARPGGMLETVSDSAAKKLTLFVLSLWALACAFFLVFFAGPRGLVILAAAFLCFLYYSFFAMKKFGGVTGDTSGYFLMICEEVIIIFAAVASFI